MPHPHLVVLRSVVTVVLSTLIGQAGWAAAFLGGESGYRVHHQVGAWVTVGICVAAAASVQFALGEVRATSAHIFVGVLLGMLATALTSWTYRHTLPTADAS